MEQIMYWGPIIFGLLLILSALVGYITFQAGCNVGFSEGYFMGLTESLEKSKTNTTQTVDIRDLWNEELETD